MSEHCIADGQGDLIFWTGSGGSMILGGEGVLGPLLDPLLTSDGGRGRDEKRLRLTKPALMPFGLLGGGLGVFKVWRFGGERGGVGGDAREAACLLCSDAGVDPLLESKSMFIQLLFWITSGPGLGVTPWVFSSTGGDSIVVETETLLGFSTPSMAEFVGSDIAASDRADLISVLTIGVSGGIKTEGGKAPSRR
jgi:hypothetical protein